MENETITNGWMKLYHPSGAQITLPVTLMAAITTEQMANAFATVQAALTVGFSVNMPGLETGENIEEIGWALRKKQKNDRGESIRLELYPASPALVHKSLVTYLDTVEQIQAFEAASGLQVRALPIYMGKDSVVRGADDETDRFIVKFPSVARVVWKDNPAYNPEETDATKKKPKRLFLRWDGVNVTTPTKTSTVEQDAAYAEAGEVLTPGGKKLSVLTDDQLKALAASKAANVTTEQRKAAEIRLKGK